MIVLQCTKCGSRNLTPGRTFWSFSCEDCKADLELYLVNPTVVRVELPSKVNFGTAGVNTTGANIPVARIRTV